MATFWLGEKRGAAVDWLTQRWVQLTGRRIDFAAYPWLEGPTGSPKGIGADYFEDLARRESLTVAQGDVSRGLTPNFSELSGPTFDPGALAPEIVHFYEHTSNYRLDVWSQWRGLFKPFGWLLAVLFSRRLEQLNMPLSPMETSSGLSSRVVHLVNPRTHLTEHVGWVRVIEPIKKVVYVGHYGICSVPGFSGPCVRVVFPLPNGSVTVVLWPEVKSDGSLVLHSSGKKFGDPGFYFVVRGGDQGAWARYMPSLKESIHVYLSPQQELRTDHRFRLWGIPYLHLHYKLNRR